MIKRIFHSPYEGRTHTDFPVKGYRNKGGLHIKEEPYGEIAELLYKVEYTGRKYIEGEMG